VDGKECAMNRNILIAGVLSMLMIVSQTTWADYMVTSEITGNDCWGIGIKICDTVKVVAFKKSGEFYEMPTSFSCTAPLNFRTVDLNIANHQFYRESRHFMSLLLKGHPGTLNHGSGERSSAVFWFDGL